MAAPPPVLVPAIQAADWSVMLDTTAALAGYGLAAGIGQVVQGLDDVDQCIRIICTTQPGEDPFRPTFGLDMTKIVDRPEQIALPQMVAVVTTAIEQWEPRVKVLSVSGRASVENPGQMIVAVKWQINLGRNSPTQRTIGGNPLSGNTEVIIR